MRWEISLSEERREKYRNFPFIGSFSGKLVVEETMEDIGMAIELIEHGSLIFANDVLVWNNVTVETTI